MHTQTHPPPWALVEHCYDLHLLLHLKKRRKVTTTHPLTHAHPYGVRDHKSEGVTFEPFPGGIGGAVDAKWPAVDFASCQVADCTHSSLRVLELTKAESPRLPRARVVDQSARERMERGEHRVCVCVCVCVCECVCTCVCVCACM